MGASPENLRRQAAANFRRQRVADARHKIEARHDAIDDHALGKARAALAEVRDSRSLAKMAWTPEGPSPNHGMQKLNTTIKAPSQNSMLRETVPPATREPHGDHDGTNIAIKAHGAASRADTQGGRPESSNTGVAPKVTARPEQDLGQIRSVFNVQAPPPPGWNTKPQKGSLFVSLEGEESQESSDDD